MEILNVTLLTVVVVLKREFWAKNFGLKNMCRNMDGVV